jgi:integrase
MTSPQKRAGRIPATYFCVVADEWHPKIIDDPQLPYQLVSGMSYLRDQIIVRMLFESGARVGEILSLTINDWRPLVGRRHGALATNKGSWGQRVKEIWWSSETSQQLRMYLNGPRRQHDPFNRRIETLSGTEPLFLTETGRAYRYPAFYYHWRQACARLGLDVHPHQARHWFVTTALRRIEAVPDEGQRQAYRQGLIAYIYWKSPETIQAYDHHLRLTDFSTIHLAIEQLVQSGQDEQVEQSDMTVAPPTTADVPPQIWERLSQLFDESEVF